MAKPARPDTPRRRTSTRGEFWRRHKFSELRKKTQPFLGGDRYVIEDLTDEESEAFWSVIEGRD